MRIAVAEYDDIEFNIPIDQDTFVLISVPPADCIKPADVDDINAKLKKIRDADKKAKNEDDPRSPNNNTLELVRFMLAHFNPDEEKTKAINQLVNRQINQINQAWAEASEISVGESEPSDDSSNEKE